MASISAEIRKEGNGVQSVVGTLCGTMFVTRGGGRSPGKMTAYAVSRKFVTLRVFYSLQFRLSSVYHVSNECKAPDS